MTQSIDITPEQELPELTALEFVRPVLGFAESRHFELVRLDADGLLCELQAVEDQNARFIVVPAAAFFPDYAPHIGEDIAAELGLRDPGHAVALLVLTVGEKVATTTANTLAPIIVNVHERRAAQVVIDNPTYGVRTRLPV